MEKAIEALKTHEFSCIVEKDGVVLHKKSGIGVKPILELMRENAEDLKGADVADKIIGRAAATALYLAGVSSVYGEIMSKHGQARLAEFGIKCEYGQLVEQIDNRDKTDMCPLEKSSFMYDDAEKSFASMMDFIDSKMAENAK